MSRFCVRCGAQVGDGVNFCGICGAPMAGAGGGQPPYPYGGGNQPVARIPGADKKVTAGILGLLFGGLGVHKFYLGYTGAGVIQLLASLFTCGMFAVIGHVEGIIYLTKPDQEFVDTYVNGKREWF